MSTRRNRSVVLRAVEVTSDGETKTTFYGPFLPHCGSATTGTRDRLYDEAYARDCQEVDIYIEDVFVSDDESDAAVVATR